ncbi:response regulator [Calothrix sp. 336/3]|uniref:response regulator n=1 Tax=Calothrix sp. 336/3 TaxID=1337936 RepID=UPI000AEE8AC7|nr:response regulator [Calothrix sp. 336/3]
MTIEKPKKQKILVVDDEPDNLDLLYRTFRRDFQVLKADSGISALQVLADEGEVAVIISDQRMPEMKGTEFLSKTVPQFPNTVRIILTGFTDIEDLVEAINAGQVYKYITKPWDPGELKAVVQRAAETYDLLNQRTEELRRANAQMALVSSLVQVAQQAGSVDKTLQSLATSFGESFTANGCILQLVTGNSLAEQQASYGTSGQIVNWLNQDFLTSEAIATQELQLSLNIPKDARLTQATYYPENGVEAHVIIPVTYLGKVLAVISLQWHKPHTLREDELKLMHLSAQLLGVICHSL